MACENEMTRRSFVGLGAMGALSAGAATIAGRSSAYADEAEEAEAEEETEEEEAAEASTEADLSDECDVAVVGMGIAGFVAASAAARDGAKVVGLDRATGPSATNAVNTAGIWAIESAEELKYDNHLTVADMFDFIWSGTHYQCNARVLRNLLPASGKAIDLVMDSGIEFQYAFADIEDDYDIDGDSADMLNRGGHIWIESGLERGELIQNCMDYYGVDSRWECEATELLCEDGAVTGVRYVNADGQTVDLSASKVIVCTGGFIQNLEMIEKYYAGARMYGPGCEYNDGAGINMIMEVGGQLGKNFTTSLNEMGGCNMNASTPYVNYSDYTQTPLHALPLLGGLFVNKDGVRFMDEGKMATKTMYCGEPLLRESQYYIIIDSATVEELEVTPLADFITESAWANMAPSVQAVFDGVTLSTMSDALVQGEEEGWVWSGEDIASLAEAAGLPGLEATVEEYNASCEAGEDDLMYKSVDFLSAIETGPFYAIQMDIAAWVTIGGIKTDEYCHVLDEDNKVIENLFVAGVDGDFWSVPYYEGGSCQGFSFASGYLSATTAVEELAE